MEFLPSQDMFPDEPVILAGPTPREQIDISDDEIIYETPEEEIKKNHISQPKKLSTSDTELCETKKIKLESFIPRCFFCRTPVSNVECMEFINRFVRYPHINKSIPFVCKDPEIGNKTREFDSLPMCQDCATTFNSRCEVTIVVTKKY